jgi:predicted DNA repair protein MutK
VFLCFEGYEKVHQMITPHDAHPNAAHAAAPALHATAFEDETVAGAIRTDFILSAEIMAISLASIATSSILMQALVLLTVGLLVTAGVYGLVAIIVKADDFGVYLAQRRGTTTRAIGKVTVHSMPAFLRMLSFVGTVAMLWVGGGIIIHGLHSYGMDGPQHMVHVISDALRAAIPSIGVLLAWLAGVVTSAVYGLVIGAIAALALVPFLTSLWRIVRLVRGAILRSGRRAQESSAAAQRRPDDTRLTP